MVYRQAGNCVRIFGEPRLWLFVLGLVFLAFFLFASFSFSEGG
jgi:hypothetical protein